MDVDEHQQHRDLLHKTREVIQVEKTLNKTLEKVEPWLLDAKVNPHRKRVRPIPSNMSEAETILMLARSLSSRTSAPAGWTPVAPITNFATPNPLPNQLRGGALATLQLERAKKAESDRKKESKAKAQKEESATGQDVTMTDATKPPAAGTDASAARPQQQRPTAANYSTQQPKQQVSMNLSDSSSSEDEDD